MKFLASLAMAMLAFASTHAAECSQEQLAAANGGDVLEKLQTACASSISIASTASTSSDPQAAARKICADKPCMDTIEWMMNNQPDCTILGVDFKAKYMSQFSTIQRACTTLGVPLAGSSAPSSSSSSTSTPAPTASSSASMFTVGVSAVVVAVAVAAQL